MKQIGLLMLAVLVVGVAGCDAGGDGGSSPVIMVEGNGPAYSTEFKESPAPPGSGTQDSREITIAKCLSSKGAVLYGASWCSYTQQQITSFKDGFQYLSYVECTEQAAVCEQNGISGYPTWIIGGSRILGYRDPTEIAAAAGCTW
jgi:hypothetical protein